MTVSYPCDADLVTLLRALMSRSKRSPALLSTLKQTESSNLSSRGDTTEGWKPPPTWDCTLSTKGSLSEISMVAEETPVLNEDPLTPRPGIQQDMNRVANKSSSINLFRLKKSRSNLRGLSSGKEMEESGQMRLARWTTDPLDYESNGDPISTDV